MRYSISHLDPNQLHSQEKASHHHHPRRPQPTTTISTTPVFFILNNSIMQAFAPSPPPTPEHLALITEALCARAKARNRAATLSTFKRNTQFQQELSLLRTSLNSNPSNHSFKQTSPIGAASVLQARLNRINPTQQPQHPQPFVEQPLQSDQSRIEAYNARMQKYFHVNHVSPVTSKHSETKFSGFTQPKPMDVEHVLTAAPVRPAISSAPVVPMITAHPEETVKESPQEEQVQRPSLVDAVVRAFNKFVERISEKNEEKDRERDADAVALGTAAAQVLAVFTTLGKH